LSSPENPIGSLTPLEPVYAQEPPPVPAKPKVEDPPWSGWDVLMLIAVTIGASFVLSSGVITLAWVLFYKTRSWLDVAKIPELVLLAQLLAYVVVLAVMYRLVEIRAGRFWQALRWNWPGTNWIYYVAGGGLLFIVLALAGSLLPIPKHLPIDRFFQTAREAAIMSIFAVTVAPLMEELFFRGFLYPVLARRLGMFGGILLTSLAFALLHGDQLKYSWAAVLIIFLVGVALTTVRAVTKSVAASFLVHVGYNGALSLLMFTSTGGFRHLEKLNQ
jgi:uncharacterized protein